MDRNSNMSHPFSNTVHHTRKHAHTNTGITYAATYKKVYTPYMSGTPARVETTPMSIFVQATARELDRALLPVRARWVRGTTPNLPRAAGAKAEAEPRAQASAQLMIACFMAIVSHQKTSCLDGQMIFRIWFWECWRNTFISLGSLHFPSHQSCAIRAAFLMVLFKMLNSKIINAQTEDQSQHKHVTSILEHCTSHT